MLIVLIAGCGEAVDVSVEEGANGAHAELVEAAAAPARSPEKPRFTQDELVGRDDVVTLSGSLACEEPGAFHVRVFPPHPDDASRRFDSHPRAGFLSEVILDEPGDFAVRVTMGHARLLLAWRDRDGDGFPSLEEAPFFVDPHGRAMDLDADLSGLVLDCAVYPTRAEDNSRSVGAADVGERGSRAPASLQLEAEGRDIYGDPVGPRNPNDIEEILDLARKEGIDVDGDGVPTSNSKFGDGAM